MLNLISKLEFALGKTLIIKDMNTILQLSDYSNSNSRTIEYVGGGNVSSSNLKILKNVASEKNIMKKNLSNKKI